MLLLRGAASEEIETEAWYSAPNFRGTYDLIISCVLTLTVCVWSALHLNVPTENSTLTQRNLRRTRWILLGIFAPELVVSTAFAQYLTAKWLRREIMQDVEYRKKNECANSKQRLTVWTITQCYFAVMGGIRIEAGPCVDDNPRLSLTPEGVRLLSFLGRLPSIEDNQIRDKSKADGLAKTLVCLQAGWMIVQTIARLVSHLPITLLEINTIGHVLCALVLYLLWWSKPLEVKDPVLLRREEWMDPFLSLMWMCSPISGSQDDEISEMRCMTYTPSSARGVHISPTVAIKTDHADDYSRAFETHFSVGSTGAKDPRKFIGPLGDFRVGASDKVTWKARYDHSVSYIAKGNTLPTASEHEIFFQIQEPQHGLQHTRHYCRRSFDDCKDHTSLSKHAIHRWRLANTLVDELWEECEKRKEYLGFFFTRSTLGHSQGSTFYTIYVDTHVPNFLGLSYLGSVDVHKDRLKSVLAFAAAAYGGLHIAAWNDYFPTQTERYLWIICSITIASSGVFLWAYFLVKERINALDVLGNQISQNWILSLIGTYLVAPLFGMARIYLVVEAFVSLRRVPAAVYQTPSFSDYFPHL
ncbi:hypothetical protein BS50DRAFT_493793 [Corynespora cassiicola Philippines]|uniref:Uncharacterized protein n=1 Tax=Corynespora cassiicola Philippines TaxID=1448308 RepID=A0A2T2NMR0_CORCC|nr:hypothetical protein BS50DRAFT_493793 [Corynespora cassiicola Philippines]